MRLALDVNRYTDYCRDVPVAVETLQRADRIFLAFIVLGELRAGFRLGTRQRENERALGEFLQSPRVEVLYADEATTHFYADLFAELRRAGTPVPTNNLWIAALVVQHDLTLFTRDRHFERVPRVPRL